MAIDIPTLDDRSYEDLLAEALARIPSLAPEWTDYNASDPGIGLVELIAWLTDMLIYRVGQIPDAVYEVFLTLLNGRVRLPTAPDIAAAAGVAPDDSAITTLNVRFGLPIDAVRAAMQGAGLAADAENRDLTPEDIDALAAGIGSLGSMLATGAAGSLEARTRVTMLSLRERSRAVTAEDYEHLAVNVWPRSRLADALAVILGLSPAAAWSLLSDHGIDPDQPIARVGAGDRDGLGEIIAQMPGLEVGIADVGPTDMLAVLGPDGGAVRAHLVSERNLYVLDPAERDRAAPGHVTLVVVPESWRTGAPLEAAASSSSPLTVALWKWLDGRRLLGTRHHVVLADVVPVRVKADLTATPSSRPPLVRAAAEDRLGRFLDPISGGADGAGWPFGRDVYLSEVYQVLAAVPGVDHVVAAQLVSDDAERLVADRGGPAHALRLEPYELATYQRVAEDIDVA